MRTVNTPFDTIEKLQHSVIQHGPSSNRIYLMKLATEDYPSIIPPLIELGKQNRYGKIFAKIPAWAKDQFISHGFQQEASVPGFYGGEVDALFLANFLTAERARLTPEIKKTIEQNIALTRKKSSDVDGDTANTRFALRRLTPENAHALTSLYG
ncbi:MAG: hypothetical protein KFH87_07020, partial [Bacteroidetes bacterium]|nr:hypothetical protein [Bacteroidota bacterium]